MSSARRVTFIDAPVDVVWDLISDVERHPDWWPRVLEVEAESGDDSRYRQVTRKLIGEGEMNMNVERIENCENLSIRCLSTGMYARFLLTEAQGGTFVEGRMGMDPDGISNRVFDAVAGKRYFSSWLRETLHGLAEAARGPVGDPGLEPGTSSLSERRSDRLS